MLVRRRRCRAEFPRAFRGLRALQPVAARTRRAPLERIERLAQRGCARLSSSSCAADEDLAAVHGEAVWGETRVNPDGTLDISSWPRPQYDGPALRALTLLRWLQHVRSDTELAGGGRPAASRSSLYPRALARSRVSTFGRKRKVCTTTRCGWRPRRWKAVRGGLRSMAMAPPPLPAAPTRSRSCARSMASGARICGSTSRACWTETPSPPRSSISPSSWRRLHALRSGETHSVRDPRMHATLARLEALFDAEYAINQSRAANRAPAMGRYAQDVYLFGRRLLFFDPGSGGVLFPRRGVRSVGNGPAGNASPDRTRRCISGNRARLYPAERRVVGTIRSAHRRAKLRAAARMELCGVHHLRAARREVISAA